VILVGVDRREKNKRQDIIEYCGGLREKAEHQKNNDNDPDCQTKCGIDLGTFNKWYGIKYQVSEIKKMHNLTKQHEAVRNSKYGKARSVDLFVIKPLQELHWDELLALPVILGLKNQNLFDNWDQKKFRINLENFGDNAVL
jgi:hypothetical protein